MNEHRLGKQLLGENLFLSENVIPKVEQISRKTQQIFIPSVEEQERFLAWYKNMSLNATNSTPPR